MEPEQGTDSRQDNQPRDFRMSLGASPPRGPSSISGKARKLPLRATHRVPDYHRRRVRQQVFERASRKQNVSRCLLTKQGSPPLSGHLSLHTSSSAARKDNKKQQRQAEINCSSSSPKETIDCIRQLSLPLRKALRCHSRGLQQRVPRHPCPASDSQDAPRAPMEATG